MKEAKRIGRLLYLWGGGGRGGEEVNSTTEDWFFFGCVRGRRADSDIGFMEVEI